jgi:tetratricopeptide (TPR) repeat protein
MAFLRTTFIIFCLFYSTSFSSQITQAVKEAFIKSYHEEHLGQIEKATFTILSVYTEKNYELNLRLGWLYYLQKKNTSSVEYYKKAASLMPKSTEALWAMVHPLTFLENWSTLNTNYLKILKLDSKNTTANYRVGLYYYYNKKYNTAKKYFSAVVNLYPTDFDALHMLAWTHYFIGNFETAKICFTRALIIQPANESAINGLKLIK